MVRTTTRAAACIGLAALAALIAVTLLGSGPALAHTALLSSDPADGAVLRDAPEQVTLSFTEPLIGAGAAVTAEGSQGSGRLATKVVGEKLTADWPSDWDGGAYTVSFRVAAEDGHVLTGSIGFRIKGTAAAAGAGAKPGGTTRSPQPAATSAPAAIEQETQPGSIPPWVWAVGALAVLGLVAVWRPLRRGGGDGD